MSKFTKISDILGEEALKKNGQNFAVKKGVAFGFWKNIAGAKFANFSMPYDIKGQTLMVTVKNPQVMQELLLYKTMLLSKIKDYYAPLNIVISDIRYDYKNWNKVNASTILEGDDSARELSYDEIEEVDLSTYEKEEMTKVTNTISNMGFLSSELKNKYIQTIKNSLKAKKIQDK